MIIDINMHHLPEDLFTKEKVLDGFLSTAPRTFGEIASLETLPSGKRHLVLEKPKGYQNLNYVEGDYSLEAKIKAIRLVFGKELPCSLYDSRYFVIKLSHLSTILTIGYRKTSIRKEKSI